MQIPSASGRTGRASALPSLPGNFSPGCARSRCLAGAAAEDQHGGSGGTGRETSASWPMLPPARPATMGQMEIRIILDRAEPPVGRLRVVPGPGHCRAGQDDEIRFTGWLGLLKALYEVTGGPGAGSVPVP